MSRRGHQMYYRVATQVGAVPTWQWKSSVPSSLATLFHFLRLLRALPHDQLRGFSSSSRQGLEEKIEQENKGLIRPPAEMQRTSEPERGISLVRVAIAGISQQPVNEPGRGGRALESRSMCALERRQELESGHGADYDLPYKFSLPLSLPQVLAWTRLLAKVHCGALQPL